jgi:hypothetical protein
MGNLAVEVLRRQVQHPETPPELITKRVVRESGASPPA